MAKDITRRTFLKTLGGGALATTLAACGHDNGANEPTEHEPQKEDMTLRTNPNTGDRVSLLGYGMMRLPVVGDSRSTARENKDADIDQETVNRLVDYAIEHGVNYFDTAPVYCRGLSERSTGIALSRHPRDKYFIATKISRIGSTRREDSVAMFENSLKELQVDYVDYLLLHAIGGGEDPLDTFNKRFMDNGILDWLVEQKERGRIRNLGFSYHGDVSIFDLMLQWHDEGRYHWDFVQIELNYLDWTFADEMNPRNTDAQYLYDELKRRGIPAVIMEPLLGGRLANVPEFVVKKMKRRRPEDSVASWAFRFAGSLDGVLTVLSGMTYMEHLRENILTYSPLLPLTRDDEEFLGEVAADIYNLKTIPCTACQYCMPCPYGIDIPAVFTHWNRCIQEGNLPNRGEQDPHYRRERRAFLVGYDRSVPRLRQADHCIACRQCVEHCPQGINIPAEMRRVDSLAEELKRSLS